MTASIEDGGPAFPHHDSGDTGTRPGMTLRDYFASLAMQSFTYGAVLPPDFDATEQLLFVAQRAYEAADAMLRAREVRA